ncbi:hypothetical protein [Dyadobacter sediminis]|uniref:Uncharacterized protein n=1 Tax=Dyadobacter sediminis TaxID=1493691 RepID=A0A5R9KKG7_9BACT|nr:hypothetical protein [Dyadobacter sediminis]TLU96718.1 hypothetical protein FEM55_06235 [Dyadobacter sediminis]GGB84593.1 hypothetical protein GCM10011325_10230 [Dyadobacter sediminis]
MNVQFLSNEKGKKTAVVIPIKDWEEIQKKLKKEKLVESLSQSVKEMKMMKAGKMAEPEINDLFE